MITLEKMIRVASRIAEKALEMHGEVNAHWLVITRKQEQLIVPAPPVPLSKDQLAVLMRRLLEELDVVQVVFVDEAWQVLAENDEQEAALDEWYKIHNSLEDYPGRIETVMFQGEDEDGRVLSGNRVMQRIGGHVMLGPLQIHTPTSSGGRFTGWLPARGTKQ